MQPGKVSMPSVEVESGRRVAVQKETIALGTKSSRIQMLRGLREVEKHRDSWRMWGQRAPTIVSAAANSRPLHLCCSLPFDRFKSPHRESVISIDQAVSTLSNTLGLLL
jgi:hypothetical protein